MKINKKLHSTALASVAIVLFLIVVSSTASASTLNVGGTSKYKTIQSAVNAAHDRDTINVAVGTYKEKVIIADKSLYFVGQKGKYPTVYGFDMSNTATELGAANVNGFKITKYGVTQAVSKLNLILQL